MDVKARIINFLETAQASNNNQNQRVMSFEDTEVNEAVWLMEGASNFLANVNLCQPTADQNFYEAIETMPIFEDADGSLKITATDITSKFNQLHIDLNSFGNSNNTEAKMVDYQIETISDNEATFFMRATMADILSNDCEALTNVENSGQDCATANYIEISPTLGEELVGDDGGWGINAADYAFELDQYLSSYINTDIYFYVNVGFAFEYVSTGIPEATLYSGILEMFNADRDAGIFIMDETIDNLICEVNNTLTANGSDLEFPICFYSADVVHSSFSSTEHFVSLGGTQFAFRLPY